MFSQNRQHNLLRRIAGRHEFVGLTPKPTWGKDSQNLVASVSLPRETLLNPLHSGRLSRESGGRTKSLIGFNYVRVAEGL